MITTRVRDSDRMHILLDMLRERYDHPSAQECFLEMSNKIPGIGRSTVYRHLAKLVDDGLAHEIRVDDGPARFDATTGCHAHFYCTRCLSMKDVMDVQITGEWPGRANECSFIAKGICNDCATKNI
ncbi:MAG: transcriptional repressor [Patescibacteria group bacterium]|nr:transcriptional repressor [Patescibacteria group bacterium]